MSLVKIRTQPIDDTLTTPFISQFQAPIIIEPYSTVELINFACRLDRDVYVNIERYTTITMYDAGVLENSVVVDFGDDRILRMDFFDKLEQALNTIIINVGWTLETLSGIANEVVQLGWTSINGITNYDLSFTMNNNYTVLGFPTSFIQPDLPGNFLTGIMTAPNPMIIAYDFDKNLTIEILNFTTNSHDAVTNYRDPIVLFIPALDWELGEDNYYPLIKYQPSNTIRIQINNEYPIHANEIIVRVMADRVNNAVAPVTLKKEYANIKTFCAMTLSFKKPNEL
jgi:hypothetical protein